MTIPFVDLKIQHRMLREELGEVFLKLMDTCSFILGPEVAQFEEAFAQFVGVKHALGVSDGLSALSLALKALGIGGGDEVILPANTFIATALAVSRVGATPVLVDCDGRSYNLDVTQVERAIGPKTKAIIPVHLTGQAADLDPLLEIAKTNGIAIVEDAAQAHGTLYKGKPCGSFGIAAGFSFYPGKNLGCCGDGGMVVTNDSELAERITRLRNYGQRVKYEHVDQGENSRLDTLQASILLAKLPRLQSWNAARANHAQQYRKLLDGTGDIVFQQHSTFSTHIYHLFIIETAHRDALQRHLEGNGIQTVIHYPTPIHLQEAFRVLGYSEGDFPVAEYLAKRVLSLPMYPELTSNQIEQVVDCVQGYFAKSASGSTASL